MMSSCNNNNNSVVAKYQPPASAAAAAGVLEAKQEQQSSVDSSVMAMARPSRNGAALPSFNDILWCTDVDGDVMTAGMDVNMVRLEKFSSRKTHRLFLDFSSSRSLSNTFENFKYSSTIHKGQTNKT